MAAINVISVLPDTNASIPFSAPLSFTIEYECLYPLQDDLEWKMIYVGSAEEEKHDQLLDSVLVGPVLQGSYKFTFEANAADPAQIPPDDLIGVTVILLTCSYKGKEFIRIGYYVNVDYTDEALKENPPDVPVLTALSRTILTDHPRVTRFPVDFDNDSTAAGMGADEAPMQDAGGAGDQAMAMDQDPEVLPQPQQHQQQHQHQQQPMVC